MKEPEMHAPVRNEGKERKGKIDANKRGKTHATG
jgi:hypothetical protein